ncbi:MAG: outer spore coat protein CotE [bacterium]
MSNYREIVTKAVIGKGKKTSKEDYVVEAEALPNTVLGCWVINHTFNGVKKNELVYVDGAFDVNVWYSHDEDSKTSVCTRTFTYSEEMNMSKVGKGTEILVRCLKQPTVTNVEIKSGVVELQVEKELAVELVGDTKVKIAALEDEDDYVDLNVVEHIDEELDNLTDDYIN